MAKADVVAAQKAAVLAGQDASLEAGLEAAYDGGALDQKASDGSFTQADIDAAKASQLAADQATIDGLTQQVQALQVDDDAKSKLIQAIQALLAPPVQS